MEPTAPGALAIGDRVTYIKYRYLGQTGTVTAVSPATAVVELDSGTVVRARFSSFERMQP